MKNNPSSFPHIPGVDIEKGISMTGGTLEFYKQVLPLFCKDAKERLPSLQQTPKADALPAFVIHVHALKGALASLGAEAISAEAARLEAAGKSGDTAFIETVLPAFTRQLAELVDNIDAALEADTGKTPPTASGSALPAALLNELTAALQAQDAAETDRVLEALGQQQMDAATRTKLEQIADEVLMTEFGNALKIVREMEG